MATILVVDDEPKITRLVRDYLENAGFSVVTAADGREALMRARTEHPDLVILDLGLPQIDGLDVTRRLRREGELPIIMLTARDDETDKLIGLELGADDYVTKPFSPRELVARVRAVLRRRDPERGGADIVLLDLMLPGMSGTEVCRALRTTSTVPVIMLTARDSEIDKVVGLELGADDYVTKPFSARELVARIRAVLRRGSEPEEAAPGALESGPVRMDVERHVVTVDGEQVQLPLKEFELLELLLRNAGRVLTRGQLIDRVWGADYVGDTKTLDVHVKRLRAKIEPDPGQPRYLVTVRGLGYKFES